jgi:hypothetical protein
MKPSTYILSIIWICLVISMIGFTSAEVNSLGTIKQSECIQIPQVCASCSYVNVSVQYPNKSIAISNKAMTPNGAGLWIYNFCNTSQLGRYDVSGMGDINGVDTGFSVLWFEVTTDGNENNLQRGVISIALILFFILLGIGFYFIHSKVDLEKWNSSLLRRYENKNYIKLVLGSIAYNVLKCPFIIYYLIGFPIIVALTDLAYAYSLGNLLDVFEALIVVYAVGVIIVGLIFFSYVQEWLVDLLEKVRDMEWGTE